MESAHKNIFQTSDFIAYSSIIFGVILEIIVPTDFSFVGIDQNMILILGAIIIILSWIVIIMAKIQFKNFFQKSSPGNATTKLVKTGVFKYSINPMYLGVVLLISGIGLVFNSAWILIMTIPVFALINTFLILSEKRYLGEKFRSEYTDYCEKTRRCI